MPTPTLASQIYSFINTVSAMALGSTAVAAVNTEDFVSLGETVLSNAESTSAFYNALASQIGRTYALYRSLPEQRLGIQRTPLEFGAILRTLEVSTIAQTKANDSWDATNPITETIMQDTTAAMCTYDSKRGTWEVATKVIYDFQLRTAFSDAESMAAFVDMIFQDMYNGMELAIRDLEATTICTGITLAASYEGSRMTAINILHAYNVAFNKTLAASAALRDADFLRYAAAEIKKHKKYMEDPSKLYNPAGYDRWTPSDECQVQVLEEFAANCATYLQSNTFHDEMVKLPTYRERSFWQGIGDGSTASRAYVSISRGSGLDETTESVNGVLAYIFDNDAMAIMIDFIRTKSDYKARYEHTEYYHKADWASLVRGTQQMLVLYMDDYYLSPPSASDVTNWATAYTSYFTKNGDGTYTAATSTYSATTAYYKVTA